MAEAATKVPMKTEEKTTEPSPSREWRPLETLRREIDRLFEDFDGGFWRSPFRRSVVDLEPFWRRELTWSATPATDVVERGKAYEITAELPGMDESNVDVKVSNGVLTIKGEKKEEKEEKKKDYYLSERHYGSFERRLRIPEGVDTEQDRGDFQERCTDRVASEKARSAEAREEDRRQGRLS